ncbi:D-ribose transporter permease [Ketogulonicigenium robustum]|uniref:D-ribose transporter permease n=1 Tax=Ketogulonicigenium robustum TaxID=92947 RepID=A0A1W6NY04_9RHOB|nr:ABC transporter permease [Ketogulonicigenium robustum]ARO14104.1 D-ribose transporter permease [Ketogulonicigenium robustum]
MTSYLRRFASLIGMAAIVVFFWINLPDTFMTARNWLNISQQVSMLLVVAVAMTVVMAMNDFDLSVGAMASLAGVVAGVLFTQGWDIGPTIAAALAIGLLGGLLNGVLIAGVGILPFIATLATMTIFSGLAMLVSGGKTIFGAAIPTAFAEFARGGIPLWEDAGRVTRLPALTVVALLVAVALWLVLEQTSYGRRLYAIGGNATAARLAGVRVAWLRASAFAFTGVGAAAAGLMYASRLASANPVQGDGLMLNAIAAVFLGMTLTQNGQPRVLATIAGVLTLAVMENGLTQMRVDSYVSKVMVGVIILLAVSLSAISRRRAARG